MEAPNNGLKKAMGTVLPVKKKAEEIVLHHGMRWVSKEGANRKPSQGVGFLI